jgi:hypothetical protein
MDVTVRLIRRTRDRRSRSELAQRRIDVGGQLGSIQSETVAGRPETIGFALIGGSVAAIGPIHTVIPRISSLEMIGGRDELLRVA